MTVTINGNGTVSGLNISPVDISQTAVGTGATSRSVQSKLRDVVSAFDFMTQAQIDDVRAGTSLLDVTSALQAAIAATENTSAGKARTLYLPGGKYKISSPLVMTKEYVTIIGDGPWTSQIIFDNVATGCLKTTTNMNYIRPILRDFGMIGNAASGRGLDLTMNSTGIVGQCYLGEIRNIAIYSGDTAFYAKGAPTGNPQFFSMVVANVSCYSYNGHAFHIWSGPGNTFQSLYALSVPAGKAGYRMTGSFTLINCNGLNEGDVWGAFGSEPSGTDGFQGDFSANDYPDATLIGCNIERFGSRTAGQGIGIRICNNYRNLNIIGGTCQRADADIPQGPSSYKALISIKYGPNATGNPVRVGWGALYLRDVVNGTGTNTPSQAYFYAENTGHFEDTSSIATVTGITTYRVNADGLSYPLLRSGYSNDIYGGFAYNPHAVSPRRLSVNHVRYNTGTVITPVGAGQAIDVTGRTKVIVTPAAAASITTATFTSTAGDNSTDYGRNGDLIIEAGNGNLTINHSASGANTFRMAGAANLTLSAGQNVHFVRSETGSTWWQA